MFQFLIWIKILNRPKKGQPLKKFKKLKNYLGLKIELAQLITEIVVNRFLYPNSIQTEPEKSSINTVGNWVSRSHPWVGSVWGFGPKLTSTPNERFQV